MSYLERRLGSLTSGALDKLSNFSGRTKKRNGSANTGDAANDEPQSEELRALRVSSPTQQQPDVTGQIGFQFNQCRSPFGGGVPFGGDPLSLAQRSTQPVLGFREDLIKAAQQQDVPSDGLVREQSIGGEEQSVSSRAKGTQIEDGQATSDTGDGNDKRMCYILPRVWFLMFALSLTRLVLFVCKVYEDFQATKHYNLTGLSGHFIISCATLFLPTVVFTIYRVSRYLQTRSDLYSQFDLNLIPSDKQTVELEELRVDDRAARDESGATTPNQHEEEGLVTARQTPTNLDANVFHDTKSDTSYGQNMGTSKDTESEADLARQHDGVPSEDPPKRPERVQRRELRISAARKSARAVEVYGESVAREATSEEVPQNILIGIGEQILHGLLFIFWQLKRQVDVLSYLIGRACVWRKPNRVEDEQLERLQLDSDGLEWFQDFYAAFLAILTQVYSLGIYWFRDQQTVLPKEATSDLGAPLVNATGFVTSKVNKVLSEASNSLEFKDLIVISELIVSSAVVVSLLVVVRRRDDGPLTRLLSSIGWGSLFSARIIVIGLAFVHLGPTLILPLVALHVASVALWVYRIALDSHNDKPEERLHEAEWDEEVREEVERDMLRQAQQVPLQQQQDALGQQSAIAADHQPTQTTGQSGSADVTQKLPTSCWAISVHLVLLTQIFTLFAIPSLFYWPIMFNLRLHFRPFKYLLIVLTQNFLLISAIWYTLVSPTAGQLYLLGAVGGLSIIGFIFVALYVALKPDFTEYFVRADMDFNQAEQAGVYYEFCSRVFKMPDLRKESFSRLLRQEQREETIVDE